MRELRVERDRNTEKFSPAIFRPHNLQIRTAKSPRWRKVSCVVQRVSMRGCVAFARLCFIALSIICFSYAAVAAQNSGASRFMRVHGQANPPYGFLQFCQSFASECRPGNTNNTRFQASPYRLIELDEINRRVNAAILPATDNELYGVDEYWTLPTVQGDCEDYVVLKRKLLMRQGWPASALLITVVMDENGEGHAILTARTSHGDFVLDNKYNEVKLWSQTPYRFVMRQSYVNPTVWMSLDPQATASPESLAGLSTK